VVGEPRKTVDQSVVNALDRENMVAGLARARLFNLLGDNGAAALAGPLLANLAVPHGRLFRSELSRQDLARRDVLATPALLDHQLD
jgi:hypothetical protein